jgi:gluconolactonase
MSWFPPPKIICAEIYTVLPAVLRKPVPTAWSIANKQGDPIDSFLEGPCFDAKGNLFVVDIPHGRVFRVEPNGHWTQVVSYDGEPNGLALHPDGRLFIADYKNGILALDPGSGAIVPVITRKNGERFKGVNDLIFSSNGDLFFTDQGQTGLHDPTGRVYRLSLSGRLDCLLDNCPSPNGLVLSRDEHVLFVAMTRDNSVWRVPLLSDGGVAKVGRFATFHGTSGPDGLAMDREGHVLVAHASLGSVFVLGPQAEPVARIVSPGGRTVTNLTFGSPTDPGHIYITDSESGTILRAPWPMV